jgi:arylsulfatase A-like enzyme
LRTFAIPLQQASDRTAFLGKWHMGNDDSPRPGFSHWVAMRGQGEALDPQFNVNGTRSRESGYVTDLLTDHAIRFMRTSGQQPFLVFLAHKALHPNVVQNDDGSTASVSVRESARIPMIIRYPPVALAGATPPGMVQTIDLAPTVLALAAVTDTTPREGRSLVPLLRDERPSWRTSLLIEYYSDTVFPRIRNMGYRAVRTERYKYIDSLELAGMDELYDLKADPCELDNLIGSERGRGTPVSMTRLGGRLPCTPAGRR